MKLKTVQFLETSKGEPVRTVAEWQSKELGYLFPGFLPEVIKLMMESKVEMNEIFSVKESSGRPKGAKDKAPRKSKTQPATPTQP